MGGTCCSTGRILGEFSFCPTPWNDSFHIRGTQNYNISVSFFLLVSIQRHLYSLSIMSRLVPSHSVPSYLVPFHSVSSYLHTKRYLNDGTKVDLRISPFNKLKLNKYNKRERFDLAKETNTILRERNPPHTLVPVTLTDSFHLRHFSPPFSTV
ncbi:hypothetical protein DVH24_040789 [Malus domestica]|uniref:Uncharacterized protein n=1 Tax=Malus domestica TaxID=3750 RepID=A0A498IBU9_MALDO|nr:hypothetical protein DVH24_040789 [Malus domestica]